MEGFEVEIVTPEKIIFSTKTNIVTLPSYEGEMSVLKDHISIITFLRPGILKVNVDKDEQKSFFVEDGTIEFFNNKLTILSSFVFNVKDLTKDFINSLVEKTKKDLGQENLTDAEKYILNYKLDTINSLN